jgi:transposase
MRGAKVEQGGMFSYVTLERRVPGDHPLRQIRVLADRGLDRLDGEFSQMYARVGRPSIAPEKLLRALLLQVLYSIHSERRLMEQLDYNLLFRWFVGLEMDDAVWDVTVFTKNRERLIKAEASQLFLAAVVAEAEQHQLLSEEHFSVDGTQIKAWASARSFVEKKDPPAPGAGSGDGGRVLLRDKVESTTDPDARLYRKAKADRSVPSYLGHVLMENRNGLVVAAEASLAATDAERAVAVALLDRSQRRKPATLGADTQYQAEEFIQALRDRDVAPHVSEYVKGNLGKNHLSEAERTDARRAISQQRRKLVERVFGWAKLDRLLGQVKQRGLRKVDWLFRMAVAAYNLTRMRRLIPIPVL